MVGVVLVSWLVVICGFVGFGLFGSFCDVCNTIVLLVSQGCFVLSMLIQFSCLWFVLFSIDLDWGMFC